MEFKPGKVRPVAVRTGTCMVKGVSLIRKVLTREGPKPQGLSGISADRFVRPLIPPIVSLGLCPFLSSTQRCGRTGPHRLLGTSGDSTVTPERNPTTSGMEAQPLATPPAFFFTIAVQSCQSLHSVFLLAVHSLHRICLRKSCQYF